MSRSQISFKEAPSRTKQAFKDESDVNNIMKKWRLSGELTHLNERQPTYGDFSDVADYLEATNRVMAADADFQALSARIRDRMGNSPAELLRFMADPDNHDEAVELGLINKPASTADPVVPKDMETPTGKPLTPPAPAAPPAAPPASPIEGGE